MTLADIETNLILTDKVNRVIQGNVAMQVTQPGGEPNSILTDKVNNDNPTQCGNASVTNASGAIW